MRTITLLFILSVTIKSSAAPLVNELQGSTSQQKSFRFFLEDVSKKISQLEANEPVHISATEADGRSLQAPFDTLQFKRKSVSFTLESHIPLVFIGYAPLSSSAEWISWDQTIRRYVPSISHDIAPDTTQPLKISHINPQTCISCHHTPNNDPNAHKSVSLIFPAFPWFEQTNDPREKEHILEAHKQNPQLFKYSNLNQTDQNNLTDFILGPTSKKSAHNHGQVTLTDAAEFDVNIRTAQRIQNNARICEQICMNDEKCLKNFLAFILLTNADYSTDREKLLAKLDETKMYLKDVLNWTSTTFSYPTGVLVNFNPFPTITSGSIMLYNHGQANRYDERVSAETTINFSRGGSPQDDPPIVEGLENYVDANGTVVFNSNNPTSPRPLQPGPLASEILRVNPLLVKIKSKDFMDDNQHFSFACFSTTRKQILSKVKNKKSMLQIVDTILNSQFDGHLDQGWPLSKKTLFALINASGNLDKNKIPKNKIRDLWRHESAGGKPAKKVFTLSSIESKTAFVKQMRVHCAGCHSGDIAMFTGTPPLPLDMDKSDDEIFQLLKNYRTKKGRSIKDRIQSKEMPPPTGSSKQSITDQERQQLIDFLEITH